MTTKVLKPILYDMKSTSAKISLRRFNEIAIEGNNRKELVLFDRNKHNTDYTSKKVCRETPTKAQFYIRPEGK